RNALAVASIVGRPKSNVASEIKIKMAVTAKTRFARTGSSGSTAFDSLHESATVGLGYLRCGKSGGKKAKIITSADRPTPTLTSEPSCARPGKPPKFKTRNAVMVVAAAQKMLGAIARRTSG